MTDVSATLDPSRMPAVGAEPVLQVLVVAADHPSTSTDG